MYNKKQMNSSIALVSVLWIPSSITPILGPIMLLKNQYYVASASLMSSPPTPIMKLEESMNLLAKPIKISLSLIY